MNPSAPVFSAATRAAGIVLAAGYVAGLVGGPLTAVVGALALITFGRILLASPEEGILDAAALALFSAALLTGALRIGSLDLTEIRGAQTVLGPTLLLGPRAAAAATWAAAVAGTLALAEWEAFPGTRERAAVAWWVAETLLGALALVSIFWGPEIAGADEGTSLAATAGSWAAATGVVTLIALGTSYLIRRIDLRKRIALLAIVLLTLVIATGVLGSVG